LRMESRIRSLEARRLHAAELALRSGAPKNSSLIMDSCRAQECHLEIIETVGLFVSGTIGRRRLYRKLLDTSRRDDARLQAPATTALGLAILLSDPAAAMGREQLRSCLRSMLSALGCRRPLPVGELLNCLGESLGRLDLNMPAVPRAGPDEPDEQWVDLAIDRQATGFRLIPASVFTRSFFRRTLSSSGAPDSQAAPACYHRENDKAPILLEQHPGLSEDIDFEYYVDDSGLSEIVLDTESLGWGEKFHAARLFALYSNLGRAALAGVPLRSQ
jgi:hypothetical protein